MSARNRIMIAAEELAEGDYVDLVPILDDAQARPWIWQPFGEDEDGRRQAVADIRMIAELEMATVESVEVDPLGGTIIYTNMVNLTVPHGYQVERGGATEEYK